MNLTYRLSDVDGTLCVVCSMPMDSEPIILDNHWPTVVKTLDLLRQYFYDEWQEKSNWPELLTRFTVKQSLPGEYWVEPITRHSMQTGVYIGLTNGGRTLPVKTDRNPAPRPKTRLPIEWQGGRWFKNTANGWKVA